MYEDGCIYFHSAKNGHKVDAIARESKASMSVIAKDVLMPEKYTTDYCSEYESDIDAEIDGAWNRLNVYELKIEHMTGKRAMP